MGTCFSLVVALDICSVCVYAANPVTSPNAASQTVRTGAPSDAVELIVVDQAGRIVQRAHTEDETA
jgi:hypothetical protein